MPTRSLVLRLLLIMVFLAPLSAISQVLTGKVTSEGNALVSASVLVKGTTTGTSTDTEGNYTLRLGPGTHEIVFSFVGYATRTETVSLKDNEEKRLNAELRPVAVDIGKIVVVVGTRADQRTVIDSPLPIDVVDARSIASSGQSAFDKALHAKVPSFNSTNTPVNDATSLLDPYEIRNMGPSRTLVLINGKRKNSSSLLYIQNSVGRGETGADLAAIPIAAIKRVEVLRDGASAIYGTDAIAGVMNVILKDDVDYTSLNLHSGITTKGDGSLYAVDLNTGTPFMGSGFLNYTIAFQRQNKTQRSGKIDPVADAATLTANTAADLAAVRAYLSRYPDGKNVAGIPDITAANFLINMSMPTSDNSNFYGNAAYVAKRVLSFANYRQPYWKQDPLFLLHRPDQEYIGYHPTFQGDLDDYNATLGYRTRRGEWKVDLSVTAGGNKQLHTVEGTRNEGLGQNSPINFKPGGYAFYHTVGNIDISRALSKTLSIAIGSEARREQFQIIPGDTASYVGPGAVSFAGIRAENAILADRFNIGGYIDMAWDISDELLLNAAIRGERYSDFGDAFVWKASSRYKTLGGKLVLRASASTGFKAPSLHQIYVQVNQYSFSGGTVIISGILNNISRGVARLGVDRLKSEKSFNFTTGVGFNPTSQLSLAIDYYNIKLKDRIVFSSRLKGPATASKLDSLLIEIGASEVAFFINAADTRTQGVDLVANATNLELGDYRLNVTLAGNYNTVTREGSIRTPDPIASVGGTIFNRTEESYLLTSRPKYKGVLGLELVTSGWSVNINNTLFGPATFVNADLPLSGRPVDDPGSKTYPRLVFDTKVVTDIVFNYKFTDMVSLSFAVNNVLNVLPSYKIEKLTATNLALAGLPPTTTDRDVRNFVDFNGRYSITSYDGSHFSITGTSLLASLSLGF